ncbi:hypothetical protein HaLaN_06441 [Haematococcus lacustris]|uniref:Uncharacterized protein n=1 Tax=Haematococcus lacustris TaxID=44745 RepID=A0A699YTH7_HAELA|nr:hypothetical protein HaLaN_06441 [Haematococcus lacustris]
MRHDPHLERALTLAYCSARQAQAAALCGLAPEQLAQRQQALSSLLPGLVLPLELSAAQLAALLTSQPQVSAHLVELVALFPGVNVVRLLAQRPALLLPHRFPAARPLFKRIAQLLPKFVGVCWRGE